MILLKQFLLVIICLIGFISFSQTDSEENILTEEENNSWKVSFNSTIKMEDKLQKIKMKLYHDRVYNVPNKGCIIILDKYTRNEKQKYECKLPLYLKIKNEYFNLDLTKNPDSYNFLRLLNEKNINEIIQYDSSQGAALFGSRGLCGAYILKSDSKNLLSQIKKMSINKGL